VSTLAGFAGAAGSADGTGSAGLFYGPHGVAVDYAGYLYIADSGNSTIRKITPAGLASTLGGLAGVWGSADGMGGTARFRYPNGVAVDGAGNVYVADTANQMIRAGAPPVQLSGAVSRKAHGGSGTFDIGLPQSGTLGIECRSGGASNDYSIVFTFVNNVSVGAANVTSGTGSVSNFSVADNQVTVNLTGVINAQTIVITLTGVNDGTNTGEAFVRMGVLVGDTTANGSVSNADVAVVKSQVGATVDSSNFRNDVNANGILSNADVSLTKSQVGTTLP
jgi:hypothetical protein